jgi:two-component system, OmpR family, sensor histidine kinase SenX3
MRRRHAAEDLDRRLRVAESDMAVVTTERDRLRAALDALETAAVVADVDGGVTHRNAAAQRFVVDPRHGDAVVAQVLDRVLARARAGESSEEELTLYGPPRRVIVVRGRQLQSERGAVGGVVFVEDVSAFRHAQDVRRDFVANVSHELKTPIGALAILAETIAAGSDGEANEKLLDQLVREADRVARIIEDLLDLSLVEAEDVPSREEVHLARLLDEAIERVASTAQARGITVRTSSSESQAIVLSCDPRQIVSAIANLLDNAVKYSTSGDVVDLVARVEHGRAIIEVIDQGVGIPTNDLERVFERFYRVDRARSRATGGTGLGLSIVRHVARAHGGDVRVSSQEGEGSTFVLTVPLDPSATAPEAGR